MHNCTMPELIPVQKDLTGKSFFSKIKEYFANRKWEVAKDYELYLPWLEETWCIPKGFIFDAASVPRIFWTIMDPNGTLLIGSIFHDFGYRYDCQLHKVSYTGEATGTEYTYLEVIHEGDSKKFMDEQFKNINDYVNDAKFMNGAAWAVLRAFGFPAWNSARKRDLKVREEVERIYN